MTKKEQFSKTLAKYLPQDEAIVEYVVTLLLQYTLTFKIVKPRKTKLGDFTSGTKTKKSQITVNGDLNQYAFLITTLHEIAHFYTFLSYGFRIKPHGIEWQKEFSGLLKNIPNYEQLPNDIQLAINKYIRKPSASSCTDLALYRVLSRYDVQDETQFLEQLTIGTCFELNNSQYKILSKARTRFLCINLDNQKNYKVHALAKVKSL